MADLSKKEREKFGLLWQEIKGLELKDVAKRYPMLDLGKIKVSDLIKMFNIFECTKVIERAKEDLIFPKTVEKETDYLELKNEIYELTLDDICKRGMSQVRVKDFLQLMRFFK